MERSTPAAPWGKGIRTGFFFLPLFVVLVTSDGHIGKLQRGTAWLHSRDPAGADGDVRPLSHTRSPRHQGSDIARQANFNNCLFSQNRFFKQSVNIHVKMSISVEIFLIFLEVVIKIMFSKSLFLNTFI